MQPIADLVLPEDLSDSETVVTVVPAQRRPSVALEDASNPGTSDDATKDRAHAAQPNKPCRQWERSRSL